MFRIVAVLTVALLGVAAAGDDVELEWKLSEGDVYQLEIESTYETGTSTAGAQVKTQSKLELKARIEIKDVDKKGNGEGTLIVESVSAEHVAAGVSVKVEDLQEELEGKKFDCEIKKDGRLKVEDLDEVDGADEVELDEHLDGLFLELPEKDVEEGDSWEADYHGQEIEIKLDKLEEKAGKTLAQIEGDAGSKTDADVGGAAGVKAKVKVKGSIEAVFDVTDGYLVELEQELETKTSTEMPGLKTSEEVTLKRIVHIKKGEK